MYHHRRCNNNQCRRDLKWVVVPAVIPITLLIWDVNDLLLQWDMDLHHHKDHHHTHHTHPTEARTHRTLLIYPMAQHRMVYILLVVQHQAAIQELHTHHTHHTLLLPTVHQDMVVVVVLLLLVTLLLCIRLLMVMEGGTKIIITNTAVLPIPATIIHRSIRKVRQRIEDRLQSLLHLLLLQLVLILLITEKQIVMILLLLRSLQNTILLR